MSSSPWLRGTVKAVLSGDTLLVMGVGRGGPPPEKQLTLSSLKAPKLGRRDGTTKDEPFAWESREFLRKKCIGKECVFRTDYKVEQLGNREFGSVFIDKENVALTVVANGWSKVNPVGVQKSPYFEDLEQAEKAATEKGLGIWTQDIDALEKAVRELPESELDAMQLLNTVGKGKPLTGIVEQVINGTLFRIILLPSFHTAVVALAGVQSPSMNRRSGENGSAGGGPEPYALQARHFSEVRALHREVRVVLEGVDKYNNLFGSILYPEGNEAVDLAQQLVKNSLAKVVEWSLNMMTTGAMKLRELDRQAKLGKEGIWTGYVPPQTNSTKLSDRFTGTVFEVVSGDCVVVMDRASRTERRVTLSSIRAPRMGTREREPEDWAVEAKDFLRKLLIGKEVNVQMEYTRKVSIANRDSIMSFGNIMVKEKGEEVTVAERIVRNGFATVVKHRAEEERSSIYEKLMEAEEEARSSRKRMHSGKDAPVHRQNDVSLPQNTSRAKQYLPSFKRNGKMNAIVEYVLSGHRLKLYIPKEGVTIAFAPSGVRTPAKPLKEKKGEPFWEEAVTFTREHIMQREVEITVETVDKSGTFLGQVVVPGAKPLDLGLVLLENGLAKLHPSFAPDRVPGGRNLEHAEARAREARLKVWEGYEEVQEEGDEENENDASSNVEPETLEVKVSEVVDGGNFYVHTDFERVAYITEQLASPSDIQSGHHPPPQSRCLAKFAADDLWYRAHVERVKGTKYQVYFIDYGNSDEVESDRLAVIEPSLASIPPQARLCGLSHIRVPGAESEHGYDAGTLFNSLVFGKKLTAVVDKEERSAWNERHPGRSQPKLMVTLIDDSTKKSIQEEMLAAGLARLDRKWKGRAAGTMEKLAEIEEKARKEHKGMFRYGDPGDDDDDDDMPHLSGNRRH